ncbi:MAG: hypothetical protein K0S37_789 [Microbacterium sp.]|nr:hypothetical protein [Microbacterium sp.]
MTIDLTLDAASTTVAFSIEEGIILETADGTTITIDATRDDLLAAIGAATGEGVTILGANGDPDRQCRECDEEVATLSSDNLCDGCVEWFATTTECPNCDERVPHNEMNHWPDLKEPVSMCDSCEHNARRSGWEPGQ